VTKVTPNMATHESDPAVQREMALTLAKIISLGLFTFSFHDHCFWILTRCCVNKMVPQ
jgi:hypothetical protein